MAPHTLQDNMQIELKLKTFRLGGISEGPSCSVQFRASSEPGLTALAPLYQTLDALVLMHRHFREAPSHPDFPERA